MVIYEVNNIFQVGDSDHFWRIPEESLFCMFSFTNRKLKVKLSFNNILSFPTYGVTCPFLKVSPLPTGHNLLNVLDKVLFRGDPF